MAATEGSSTSVGSPTSSYDTALCLIPPKHLWPSVNRLRMLYDTKAYEKWPPHINIVYPFVGIDSLSSALESILSELKTWRQESEDSKLLVQLGEAGIFPHRHGNTIFICDKDPARSSRLAELRERILRVLGQSPGSYQMHMTIGQSEDLNSSSHKFLYEKAELLPTIKWEVEEIHILIRERMHIDGNATSQMKLWGTIDLTTLSISPLNVPTPFHEPETLAQVIDVEHDVIADISLPGRMPYVYSPSDEKWKIYPSSAAAAAAASSSQHTEVSLPQSLIVASYNVLAEFKYPPSQSRYPIIIRNLLDRSATSDVLVLEEVTDSFLSYLLRDDGIRQEYQFVSCGPPEQLDIEPLPSHLNTVVFSKWSFSWDWITFRRRHKGSVIVRFDNIGKPNENGFLPAILSTVHLTCGLTDGSVANKKLELQAILKYLSQSYPQNPWIVAGDFNITTSAYTINAALKKKAISSQTASYLAALETMISEAGLVDAWSYARVHHGDSSFEQDQRHLSEAYEGEEGATFDPIVNELAAEIVGSGFNNRPQRYDRILVKGEDLFAVSRFTMFGKIKGLLDNAAQTEEQTSYGSDHWGVRCLLKFTSQAEVNSTDGNSKLLVPVESKSAPGALGDVSQLRECLMERNVFPSGEDINGREAALNLLKEVILEDGGSGQIRGKPVFVVVPVGSYGLGVWTSSSDIDCLCIGPISPKTFFTLAAQRLRKAAARGVRVLRRVKAHSGTMLELEVQGIRMDLQYCPSTFIAETWPYATHLPPTDPVFSLSTQILAKLKPARDLYYLRRTVPDFAAFKVAYLFIKCWAKQRGIYAAKFGYLGGIHIAILLSRVCKLLISGGGQTVVSIPTIITTFFDHYARFDWATRMVFDPFFHNKRLRYMRTAREPMVILGFHGPSLNVALTASLPSVRTISEELKRASVLLSSPSDEMTWSRFLGGDGGKDFAESGSQSSGAEFLKSYKTYVRIDAQFWGVSLAKGSGFVGWLESRCVMLLVGKFVFRLYLR